MAGMTSAVGRVCGSGSSGIAAAARAGASGKGLRRQQVKSVWSARVTRRRTGARAAPEGEEDGGGVGSSGDGAGKGVEVPDEVAEFAEVGVDGSWLNSIVKETKLIDWPSRNEVRLRNTCPSRDSCRALDAPSPRGNQLESQWRGGGKYKIRNPIHYFGIPKSVFGPQHNIWRFLKTFF